MEAAVSGFLQSVVQFLNSGYGFIDRLGLSFEGLAIAAALFVIALAFSIREAVSWFLKIDDMKREVRSLNGVVANLEGEIRVLQSLIGQLGQPQFGSKSEPVEITKPAVAIVPPPMAPKSSGPTALYEPPSDSSDDDDEGFTHSTGMKTGSFPIQY